MRKRKLYLSELILRYNEVETYEIVIISKSISYTWDFPNVKEALKYLPNDIYWELQVTRYEILDNVITIFCN